MSARGVGVAERGLQRPGQVHAVHDGSRGIDARPRGVESARLAQRARGQRVRVARRHRAGDRGDLAVLLGVLDVEGGLLLAVEQCALSLHSASVVVVLTTSTLPSEVTGEWVAPVPPLGAMFPELAAEDRAVRRG